MDCNTLWNLVTNKDLSNDEVDKFSIEEVKILDNLYTCYFAQMGDYVNMKPPFSTNYIKINQKIKRINL